MEVTTVFGHSHKMWWYLLGVVGLMCAVDTAVLSGWGVGCTEQKGIETIHDEELSPFTLNFLVKIDQHQKPGTLLTHRDSHISNDHYQKSTVRIFCP